MENKITLLDCTLRDGGHLNEGVFGEQMIRRTISNLVKADIDIIEIGFLMEDAYDMDTARFQTIEDAKKVLPKDKGNSHFSLMADYINLDNLEDCDGTIEYIRLSFKRQRLDWALETVRKLKEKGYKCFLNPVNCNVYSDEEYIEVIRRVNEAAPYGFSIVDTFGVLRKRDLSRLYHIVENNLNEDICIGVHLHENMGLAFLLAQHFIEIHNPKRKINIDGSLLGMGRSPGNLCLEQLMDYMNEQYDCHYELEPALDIISDYIQPLKEDKKWGYTIPYYLSAKYGLHRTYAEYLMEKWKLDTKDIMRILSKVERKEAEYFNEEYIEQLYREYIQVWIDDSRDVLKIKKEIGNKEVLLIAPGSSIGAYRKEIAEISRKENICSIGIGFAPDFCDVDYVWLSTPKRYNQYDFAGKNVKVVITSNLLHDAETYDYVFNYKSLIDHDGIVSDNSTLMALHFLKDLEKENVHIAGFDGFRKSQPNFYGQIVNREQRKETLNRTVSEILTSSYREMKFDFITPTLYGS